MKNQVQLITYADRLGGGNISDLHRLLNGPLTGLFGGVHILPFYYPRNGTDAGFDPIDHFLFTHNLFVGPVTAALRTHLVFDMQPRRASFSE